MTTLKSNAMLQGEKYRIISTLGQGGFGITYLAEQTMLERKVAIKEFFIKDFCGRDEASSQVTLGMGEIRETVNRYREKFLKEARNIAKLSHPNIVRIMDVFEENGTAYYVMEYCEKGSLASMVNVNGSLSEQVATRYIIQVAEALEYLHQRKMNHLDVKPGNIMLNDKDEAILIDFGLSKQYDAAGQQTSTTPVGISEGYAPMEQYRQGGVDEFSPETDIYALGATFFKLLTGITPPSASDVNEDGVPMDELKAKGISQAAIAVICKAMESRKHDRMKNVQKFISTLVTIPDEDETIYSQVASKEKALEQKAQAGDAEAQYLLGTMFDEGGVMPQNYKKAIYWYQRAAEQGHPDAQYKIGSYTKDWAKAAYWYLKAAEQGNAGAQWRIGYCYSRGAGVKSDYSKAAYWYQKAAEQGNVYAQIKLGNCYKEGKIFAKDYSKAVYWYQKAAEQGDAFAQFKLGNCYKEGKIFAKDYSKAVYWYQKAAEQGNACAQIKLGVCYEKGYGIKKNLSQAKFWYQKAAEREFYKNGHGASDLVRSFDSRRVPFVNAFFVTIGVIGIIISIIMASKMIASKFWQDSNIYSWISFIILLSIVGGFGSYIADTSLSKIYSYKEHNECIKKLTDDGNILYCCDDEAYTSF